ncbi:MAG: hypothetical protein AL399_05990, partial [Candidatus [Bacteroides] periocalifornicus]
MRAEKPLKIGCKLAKFFMRYATWGDFFLATLACSPVAIAPVAGGVQLHTNALPSPYHRRCSFGFQRKIRTNSDDGVRLVRRWLGDGVGIG